MKIHGVEILRITDFRRFFDMTDFLVHARNYAKWIQTLDLGIFCKSKLEGQLISHVRIWCSGRELPTTFNEGQINLLDGNWVSLGKIGNILNEFREEIKYKDRLGLAYLFLLLKDTWDAEIIRNACLIFLEFKTGVPIGDFLSVHHDLSFPKGESQYKDLTRIFLANTMHPEGITISDGERTVILNTGECVVGLFNNKRECVKLLPNTATNEDNTIKMNLKVDLESEKPYVEIIRPEGKEKIYDVCSFWIEPGDYIAILKNDGTFEFDRSSCFSLNMDYVAFKSNHPDRLIAGIERNYGNYDFYSI